MRRDRAYLRSECVHVSGQSWRARGAPTAEPRRSESGSRQRVSRLQRGGRTARELLPPGGRLTASPRALPAGVDAPRRGKANKLIKKKGPIQPERLQSFDRIFSIPLLPPLPVPAECGAAEGGTGGPGGRNREAARLPGGWSSGCGAMD